MNIPHIRNVGYTIFVIGVVIKMYCPIPEVQENLPFRFVKIPAYVVLMFVQSIV